MPDLIHRGRCHNCTLQFDNAALYNKAIAAVNGKRFELILRPEKKEKQIDPMRKFLFAVIYTAIAEVAYGAATRTNIDSVHDGLKSKYLTVFDEKLKTFRTLSISDTKGEVDNLRLTLYVEECKQYGSETFGIEWPDIESREYTDADIR